LEVFIESVIGGWKSAGDYTLEKKGNTETLTALKNPLTTPIFPLSFTASNIMLYPAIQ